MALPSHLGIENGYYFLNLAFTVLAFCTVSMYVRNKKMGAMTKPPSETCLAEAVKTKAFLLECHCKVSRISRRFLDYV